ncbi:MULTISPECIES: T9SS type A sorting domain-containing protein [Flavobacterium]|uniref:Secretion system C-terminal sorting domain-containing protein n=1 Tax=Flavobacterium hankyongi TaxID=1176532 RepID=A0ABP9A430_9FLAO|nr:T9SS type A sorting domain-containing protein [Flavobacterium sp. N1846]
MKNILKILFFILINFKIYAQEQPTIKFTTHLSSVGDTYIPICGTEQRVDNIKVGFSYCGGTNLPNDCVSPKCNIGNPYKAIVTLFKNNTVFSEHEFTLSSLYFYETFTNVSVSSGSIFKARVQFFRKKNLCIGYELLRDIYSSNLTVPVLNGTPDFNINGIPIPIDGSAIQACISNIKINAGATSCETAYNITVEECDQYWNRTYDYEFGVWLNGEAPDNINLQNIASTYSVPPYYTGNPSRAGSILIDGNLANGSERYYRVKVCTGPIWTCKTALLKVISGCKQANDSNISENQNESNPKVTVISNNDNSLILNNINKIDDNYDLISVYPNPTNGVFKININEENANYKIYNSNGNIVQSKFLIKDENLIDLSNEPKGIYLINIHIKNKIILKKIVKQ